MVGSVKRMSARPETVLGGLKNRLQQNGKSFGAECTRPVGNVGEHNHKMAKRLRVNESVWLHSAESRIYFYLPNDLNILLIQRFFCSMLGWT